MVVKVPVRPFGWTSQETSASKMTRWARGYNTAKGYMESDKGFFVNRQIAGATNKGALSRTHQTEDGDEYVWFYCAGSLYKNDGATPTSIASSLDDVFNPDTARFPEANISVIVGGTNTKAYLVRENTGETDIEAETFDLLEPTVPSPTINGAAGSWAAGTYQLRIAWRDEDNNIVTMSSPGGPDAVVVSLNDEVVVNRPGSPPARATHWRYAFTAAGASDSPSNYLYWEDVAVGTTTKTLTSGLPSVQTTQAFADRNGTYIQGDMPLSAVDIVAVHEGRLWIASTASNKVYASERGVPNHWDLNNEILSGAESGWAGMVRGLASTGSNLYVFTADSIHEIFGTFQHDDEGTNATYAWMTRTRVVDRNIGLASRASLTVIGGALYFLSTQGPAVLAGGSVRLVGADDIRAERACWDYDNIDRAHAAEDPDNNLVLFAIPRQTNASREMDGASTAGVCDTIYRWDYVHNVWAAPLAMETVDLVARTNGSQGATGERRSFLMACGPHGTVLRMNAGRAGGTSDGVVTSSDFDGILATASTTTQVTIPMSGISADELIGELVVLYYPTDDSNFPGMYVVKTISDNSATSGGSITIDWQGALTVPSGTNWTVRRAGILIAADMRIDFRELVQAEPGSVFDLQRVDALWRDVVGSEAIA